MRRFLEFLSLQCTYTKTHRSNCVLFSLALTFPEDKEQEIVIETIVEEFSSFDDELYKRVAEQLGSSRKEPNEEDTSKHLKEVTNIPSKEMEENKNPLKCSEATISNSIEQINGFSSNKISEGKC